jgi:putative nucleotidyltransferase with HDIG domain
MTSNTTGCRLILKGMVRGLDLKKPILYFEKELGLSNEKIQDLLARPPRVLQEFANEQGAELAKATLAKLGFLTKTEPFVRYPSFPVAVSSNNESLIRKELSKILRCRMSLLLLFIQVGMAGNEARLPSMMGTFQDKVAQAFRESDTVIGLDEFHLILLGFTTDAAGIKPFQSKAHRVLKRLLPDGALVTSGHALFPEDGQTVEVLAAVAESRRRERHGARLSGALEAGSAKTERPLAPADDRTGMKPLQVSFSQATGRVFKRLMSMDAQTLWPSLSQIQKKEQREFWARLPFDLPLASTLDKVIKDPSTSPPDPSAEMYLHTILQQMESESGYEGRERMRKQVLAKLNRTEELPMLPSMAMQIFKIASNPNSSGTELENVIMKDPALASKLLKTVNSAFYGNPQKVSAIKQAVALLGTEEIMDMAFGLATAKVFQFKTAPGLPDPKSLWRHSICTALIAQYLSRNMATYQELGIFTAGLLHDIGKIFLMDKFPDVYTQVFDGMEKYSLPLYEMEEEFFGLNHGTVGKYLATRWNLPEPLVQAITFSHQPFFASSYAELAAIVGLSNHLYYRATMAEGAARDAMERSHWLSVGHWIVLTRLFTDLNEKKLDSLTREAVKLIEENRGLLETLQ